MADQKLTELTELTSASGDDLTYIVDDPGGSPLSRKITVSNLLATYLSTFQLINEIKGWPPIVNTGDLDALNLWWDKLGTPTTAPSVQDVSAAGLTDTYELAMKVVADASSEGLYQRFTYADEPRVKSGRAFSTLWAIWCVSGVGVTLSIKNSSAEETSATKVTAAAWTIVEVPNHTLAGTYADIILQTDGAGTFYAVPLGANIGVRGFPLRARGSRYIDVAFTGLVSGVDPGGADWADLDITANSSPLAHTVYLHTGYINQTTAQKRIHLRRNGSTDATGNIGQLNDAAGGLSYYMKHSISMDDGQVIEWKSSAAAGDTESVTIAILGYWEWE